MKSENLIKFCKSNCEYFEGTNHFAIQLCLNINEIVKLVDRIKEVVYEINNFASEYDFDENTPGNGYRSFIEIVDAAIAYTEGISRKIEESRKGFLFNKKKCFQVRFVLRLKKMQNWNF